MAGSLRERLSAKTRRRAVVPVELGQLSDQDQGRVVEAQAEILRAIKDGDQERVDQLQSEIDELQSSVVAEIRFTALPPTDFEKVIALYPGEDGVDREKALPVLAALCADDEELQDDEWWAEQVTSGNWSQGEVNALWRALLHINTSAPNPYIPKD